MSMQLTSNTILQQIFTQIKRENNFFRSSRKRLNFNISEVKFLRNYAFLKTVLVGWGSSMSAAKLVCTPAAERNKEPILQALKKYIPSYIEECAKNDRKTLHCLEISSGSGQHVVLFAKHFPSISFQPSEYDKKMLKSINAYITEEKVENVKPPVYIDIRDDYKTWSISESLNEGELDIMININMVHISPYPCAEGLFRTTGKLLRTSGLLFTYGAYSFNGKITPESNVNFDIHLRSQNPEWGIRDVESQLVELASNAGLRLVETIAMPANNYVLVWKKEN